MEELDYPEGMSEDQLYDSVQKVLNRRGYNDRNGISEALYDSGSVTVQVEEDVLEITGPSSSEEDLIVTLPEPEIQN